MQKERVINWFPWKTASAVVFTLGCAGAWAEQKLPLTTVCIDPEPPPWAYWERDKYQQLTEQLTGVSVETIRVSLSRIGRTAIFVGNIPWARCLLMVENREIDFAMDAYFDTARARRFDYSVHYRTSTPQVFYRRKEPVVINDVSDLKRYKGCGLVGWSYEHYGLTGKELDLGVGLDNQVQKLKAKRCNYFVEELETIYSNKLVGPDYLNDSEIGHAPVPGAKPPTSHLITAKNSEASKYLPALNRAITGLIKSGVAESIWKKHAGELPFKP